MNRIVAVVCTFVLLMSAMVRAQGVNVGDKPQLDFQAVGGGQVSMNALKGKIVVVDFWATWCGPCMAEAGHMVELNEKYGPKGLQMIGISLDQNAQKMATVAKEKGFNWPQYCDGQGWKTKFAREWGVNGIPATYIISPDGVVLWKGHPGGIDAPLEKAFQTNPPRLVDPAILTAANKAVDDASAALKEGNTIQAFKLMGGISAEAKKDGAFASKAAAMATELESAGDKLIGEVDPMIEAKQWGPASARLTDIMKALPGSPVATKARAKLDTMLASPEAKAGIEAEKKNAAATAELEIAEKLKAGKKDADAYMKFKQVAKTYAGTPSGDSAAAAVAEYEKNPAFVKQVNESTAGAKAKGMMSMANSYAQAGRTDMAKKKYQEVIDQFPGTSFADTAKAELGKLK